MNRMEWEVVGMNTEKTTNEVCAIHWLIKRWFWKNLSIIFKVNIETIVNKLKNIFTTEFMVAILCIFSVDEVSKI